MAKKKKTTPSPLNGLVESITDALQGGTIPMIQNAMQIREQQKYMDERSRMAFSLYVHKISIIVGEEEKAAEKCFRMADAFIKVRDAQGKSVIGNPIPDVPGM